jgi:hypothetical protein
MDYVGEHSVVGKSVMELIQEQGRSGTWPPRQSWSCLTFGPTRSATIATVTATVVCDRALS